jgi:hypothetical protein
MEVTSNGNDFRWEQKEIMILRELGERSQICVN